MRNQSNTLLPAVLAATIMTCATAIPAHAGDSKDKEAKELRLFSQAGISLSDAIKAAEQKTGGKAMEADIDDDSATVQFDVEIVKDGKIYEVKVDGKTGAVLKVSLEDESDKNAEHGKD